MRQHLASGFSVGVCTFVLAASASAVPAPKLVTSDADGGPVVYALADGSWLGLWDFAFSDHAAAVTFPSAGELQAAFSGGEILGFYGPEFEPFDFPQSFARGRYDGALWVRWRSDPGLDLTYSWEYVNRGGVTKLGSDTLAASATRSGDPLAISIPEPSVLALLATGLIVLGLTRLRPRQPTDIGDSI